MDRRELLGLGATSLVATTTGVETSAQDRSRPRAESDFRQLHAGREEPILEPGLEIIDAHHHLFVRPGQRYLIDEYLTDARAGHRVVGSVYVEASAFLGRHGPETLRPLGEIEFANGVGAMCASGGYGDIHACAAIVGYADLRFGDGIAELLDKAIERAPDRFRGVRQTTMEPKSDEALRFMPHPPPKGVMRHPGFRSGFAQLVKRGLTFDAAVFHHQLPDVVDLANAFPDAKIILNHCGLPLAMVGSEASRNDMFHEHRRLMRELGRCPNVHCKIGGLGLPFWGFRFEERSEPIGYRELADAWRPHVEATIEAFGSERCMMESNYPPDSRSAGFVPLWNALKYIVRSASADEKKALFSMNAARAYRIA